MFKKIVMRNTSIEYIKMDDVRSNVEHFGGNFSHSGSSNMKFVVTL